MISRVKDLADRLLRLPELAGFKGTDFDTSEAARIEREIFAKKKILHFLYDEYSRPFIESARRAAAGAKILEIGSGTSPLKRKLPGIITSDVTRLDWLDIVLSASALPFADGSLDRIFLMFVMHHLGDVDAFLSEARRCLKPGGELVIVDPAITPFSRRYYRIHVDGMDTETEAWGFEGKGRLTGSNIALAWIVFFRDRQRFARLYPEFSIEKVEYNTCLSFLLSGGLRLRQLLPDFMLKALFTGENWVIRNVTSRIAVTMALTIRRR